MGYFPNGSAALDYESRYCDRCVHQKPNSGGCAVWLLHLMSNYSEDKQIAGMLNALIPRTASGNEQCTMFHEGASDG